MDVAVGPVIAPAYLRAFAEVDAWRGRCVRHFAKLEQGIAQFIAVHDPDALAAGYGLGCRIKQLATFLEAAPAASPQLHKALRELEASKTQREAIVHGDGVIFVSMTGDWLWECRYLRAKEQTPTIEIFRLAEAHAFEKDLKRRVQSLCDRLRGFKTS